MVLIEENNISSGIDGFACGELWNPMQATSQTLFLQKYPATNLTKLSTLKNIEP